MVRVDVSGEGRKLSMAGHFHGDRWRRADLDEPGGRGMAKIVEAQILDLCVADQTLAYD